MQSEMNKIANSCLQLGLNLSQTDTFPFVSSCYFNKIRTINKEICTQILKNILKILSLATLNLTKLPIIGFCININVPSVVIYAIVSISNQINYIIVFGKIKQLENLYFFK
jgi:hypothetical protein